MTGYRLFDCFIFATLAFLFYLVKHKKDKDNPSIFDNAKIIRTWSPIILCSLLAIIAFLFWLTE